MYQLLSVQTVHVQYRERIILELHMRIKASQRRV